MKQKQKPLSFSLHPDNIAYVKQQQAVKHRNQSHWMDDLLTHLRLKSEPVKQEVVIAKVATKRFVPPTVEQVREYCDSRCNNVDPQNFVDHYTGNGWVRGRTKVKCWKACVRTWENKDKPQVKVTENLGGNW